MRLTSGGEDFYVRPELVEAIYVEAEGDVRIRLASGREFAVDGGLSVIAAKLGLAPKAPKPIQPSVRQTEPLTAAPEFLSAANLATLHEWASHRCPREIPRMGEHVEACLTWHASRGIKRRSWVATVMMWIRKDVQRRTLSAPAPAPDLVPLLAAAEVATTTGRFGKVGG